MVTESNKKQVEEPITGEDDASVDPDRLAAIRMPTAFLKWVISTPLPKDDTNNLWLDTLPPGSRELRPPPKRKVLPPWAFAALVTFIAAAIATGLAFLLLGYFDSSPEDERSGSEVLRPPTSQIAGEASAAKAAEATERPDASTDAKHTTEAESPPPEEQNREVQKPTAKPTKASPAARPAPKNVPVPTQEPKSSPTEETPVRSKPSLFEME